MIINLIYLEKSYEILSFSLSHFVMETILFYATINEKRIEETENSSKNYYYKKYIYILQWLLNAMHENSPITKTNFT